MGKATKIGRRNAEADLARIQQAHDLMSELGAACAADAQGKSVKQLSLDEQVGEVTESLMELLTGGLVTGDVPWMPGGDDMPCVCAVYPAYAIVLVDDQHYQAPYVMEGDEAVIAPFDQWTRVEQAWVAQKTAEAVTKAGKTRAVTVKAITPDTITVGGYGVVFGGVDLTGDTFTKSTNFWLSQMPGPRPVLYEHGFDDAIDLAVLGSTVKVEADDEGLWVEAELSRHSRYMKEVEKLLAQGVLGWSSGSAGHLVRRDVDADKALITSWPILEFSLTPTPAEPRTLGVQAVRSLAAALPAVKAIIGDNLPDGGVNTTEDEMDEQKNTVVEAAPVPVDVAAIARQAAEEAVKMYRDNEPPLKTAGVAVPNIIFGKRDDDPFKTWLHLGDRAPESVKTALVEGTGANGGYLVPALYSQDIITPLANMSYLRRAGARVININGTNSFNIPALTYSAAAALIAEAGTFSESDPTLAQVTFVPYKFGKLSQASEEVVADSRFDVWGEILQPDYVQAFAEAENTYFTTGTGSSQPQGVVTGATTGVTAASKTAFTADELISTFFALDYKYRPNGTWMMHDTVLAYIRKMKDAEGRYLWEPGLNGETNGTLMGRPIITNNSMDSAFTTGKKLVLFGNFNYYYIGDFAGFTIQRLVELYAATGQIGFRAHKRFDGHVMLSTAFQLLVLG